MNPAQRVALNYIHFLVAAQRSFTCQETARCQPEGASAPARMTPLPACYGGSSPTRRPVAGAPGPGAVGRWSAGRALLPGDFRLYAKPWSGLTKNGYFRQSLGAVKERGFAPRDLLFDDWHSRDGDGEPWASNDLALPPEQRAELARQAWGVEN